MTKRILNTLNGLRDLLTKEQTQILKVAGMLMVPALLTKITGLLVGLLTANKLGRGSVFETFLYANELPSFLAEIILTGAISTLVIPIFIQAKEESEEVFFRFYSTVINLLLGAFTVIALFVILFASPIFDFTVEHIINPAEDTCLYPYYYDKAEFARRENLPLTDPKNCVNFSGSQIVTLMQALMLPQLILGMSVFVASGLNVYNRFLLPQLAPLFYNVGRIFGVMVLLPISQTNPGDPGSPWALVAGVYTGSVLHLIIQLPLARMLGLHYKFEIDLSISYLKNFFAVSIPRLIAYSADSFGLVLNKLIISGFSAGFLSTMFYAQSLANMVPGVIGYAFSVASFPTLSRLYAQKRFAEINDIVINMLNQIIFLAAPIILALIVLRLPIVRLAYGLGAGTDFDRLDTAIVGWTLLFFAIGIVFTTTKWYLYRLFYVAQNTVVPFFVSFFSLGLTIVLTIMLGNLFSHADQFAINRIPLTFNNLFTAGEGLAAIGGAALAISITAFIEFIILLILVNQVVVKLDFSHLFTSFLRKFWPIVLSGALMYLMYTIWDTFSLPIDASESFAGSTTVNLLLLTGVTTATTFMVYYLLCHLFGVEELKILRRILNPIFKLGGIYIK